jgi:membrane-associated phospholipid phosphatase
MMRRSVAYICTLGVWFGVIIPGAWAEIPSAPTGASALLSDLKYLANSVAGDAHDIITAPLHIREADTLLQSPKFYYTLLGAGVLFGGSFALDQTLHSRLEHMSSNDADLLQNISYGSIALGSAALYGYGLYSGDQRAREYTLTAGEGAGIATLLNIGIKAGFGRLRPRESSSHTAFFRGGRSFVSGEVVPMFGLATGISEFFENEWYVAGPAYSLALLDGFGRMGHNAHWFSDVVGAALLGSGTTELLLYLHKQRDDLPGHFRIFPLTAFDDGSAQRLHRPTPFGIGMSFIW